MIRLGKTLCLRWAEHPADELVRTCDVTLKLTRKVCRGIANADRRIKALGDDARVAELARETNHLFIDIMALKTEIEKIRRELRQAMKTVKK